MFTNRAAQPSTVGKNGMVCANNHAVANNAVMPGLKLWCAQQQ
jgi:hypothetical protein